MSPLNVAVKFIGLLLLVVPALALMLYAAT